jgi:hypothetical protein
MRTVLVTLGTWLLKKWVGNYGTYCAKSNAELSSIVKRRFILLSVPSRLFSFVLIKVGVNYGNPLIIITITRIIANIIKSRRAVRKPPIVFCTGFASS